MNTLHRLILSSILLSGSVATAWCQTPAPTPPMGWNSWDSFGTGVTEAEVKANADYMAKYMAKSGWQYIVVDIQWSEPNPKTHGYRPGAELNMDEYGRLIPAVNRFPSAANGQGFKPLADYVHSKGLKFGMHIMRGIPRRAVDADLPVFGQQGQGCEHRQQDVHLPVEFRHVWHRCHQGRRAGLLRLAGEAVRRVGSGFHQGRRHVRLRRERRSQPGDRGAE